MVSVQDVVDLAGRVDAGAWLLDEAIPGWFRRIDTARLQIASSTDCILGQLLGLAAVQNRPLGLDAPDLFKYGFLGDWDADRNRLHIALWVAQISHRVRQTEMEIEALEHANR